MRNVNIPVSLIRGGGVILAAIIGAISPAPGWVKSRAKPPAPRMVSSHALHITPGKENTPLQDVFTAAYLDNPRNVYPSALIQFTDPFTSSSSLKQFTESGFTASSLTISRGTTVVAVSGKEESILAEASSSFSMPQLMVVNNVNLTSSTASGFNDTGVGIVKDANNYLFAIYDALNKVVLFSIKINGSKALLSTTSHTLPSSFRLGLSLVMNRGTMWVDTGSGFTALITTGLASKYDFSVVGNLSGWMAATLTSENAGNATWHYTGFSAGSFGTTCTRDMTLVTKEDGTPYVINGDIVTLTATCGDTVGTGYCGVFQYNLTKNTLTQTGVIMVKRGGHIYNDLSAHVIWYPNGRRKLLLSTWGNGFGGGINILYTQTTTDILTGANVVSGMVQLNLPGLSTGYGSYDQMLVFDASRSRWLLAYVITQNTTFTGSPFYAAAAYSPDLLTWTLIGADTGHQGWEGAKIINAAGTYWIAVGGPAGAGNSSRVYDKNLKFQGTLNATFSGGSQTQPHPMVFGVGSTEYLITFDNHQYGLTSFTWGNWIVQTAQRYGH